MPIIYNPPYNHKNFQLVSSALQFLAIVADRSRYRNLFEDSGTLSSICEKVIIPNMEFRGRLNVGSRRELL